MFQIQKCWGVLFLLAIALAGRSIHAANTLTVSIKLASLPTTITLCRDPTAYALYGVDEQFQIPINIDGNLNTGDANGNDVVLAASPTAVSSPCSPTVVNTNGNIQAGVGVWIDGLGQFVGSSSTVDVVTDLATSTLVLSTPVAGDLAGVSSGSSFQAITISPYSSSGNVLQAQDATAQFGPAGSVTSPAGDVQGCSAPCSPAVSWYGMTDIVGASARIGLPQIGNGIFVEFHVAALHSTIGTCRYPNAFFQDGVYDSSWAALFNIPGVDNGDGAGGYDVGLFVLTPPQESSCSTGSVDTASGLLGYVFQFDSQGGVYTAVDVAPVTVDVAHGKITIEGDANASYFAGLSSKSLVSIATQAIYYAGGAQASGDAAGLPFHYSGITVSDPALDVQNCVSPCSTAVAWYPEIDLIGASVKPADDIFHGGFE